MTTTLQSAEQLDLVEIFGLAMPYWLAFVSSWHAYKGVCEDKMDGEKV